MDRKILQARIEWMHALQGLAIATYGLGLSDKPSTPHSENSFHQTENLTHRGLKVEDQPIILHLWRSDMDNSHFRAILDELGVDYKLHTRTSDESGLPSEDCFTIAPSNF